jgi:hypothetical protein
MNMKNLICVDLTALTYDQVRKFCSEFEFNEEVVLKLKKESYAKVWFTKTGFGIAFTLAQHNIWKIKDYDSIRYFNDFISSLNSTPIYSPKEEEITSNSKEFNTELSVDSILEKIFKYGRESMTPEEKKFLDNQ